jgi:Tol biopolymer transport system component/predicted Ser/Thr protein kinase
MIGKTLGHYQVVDKLGEGGMGVVYKARDTHLDRFVAIKTLPAERVSDLERKRRFVQEAKAASALNHPNIVHVYDIDQADGIDFIAMEYVPGKTLDEVIPRKGMRLNDMLKCAVQVADALATSHAAGIVHRDLKPANVMVADKGLVKVLDFGLAKLTEPLESDESRTTETMEPHTEEGTIVGTVAYMSPEQAEGKKVDARSDIFSMGSVLYEMVTGQKAFQGTSKMSTLSAILHQEPKPVSWTAQAVPTDLEKLISRCLRKDPERRIQHMGDVNLALLELKEDSESGRLQATPAAAKQALSMRLALVVAAIVVLIAGGWYWLRPQRSPEPEAPLTAVPLTSYPGIEDNPSFSPDGNYVAFEWCPDGPGMNCDIYIKQIGVEPPFRLTTDPAEDFSPAWSPDGRFIAFLRQHAPTGATVMLIPQRGGQERMLGESDATPRSEELPGPYLAWTPDSRWLVFRSAESGTPGNGLFLLSLETLQERRLTDKGSDSGPAFSPDGRTLAFTRPSAMGLDIYLLNFGENYEPLGPPQRVAETGDSFRFSPAWTPDGSEIVFSAASFTQSGLWRMAVGKPAKPRQLAVASEDVGQSAVSHQGNRLAYMVPKSNAGIWRVDLRDPGRKPGTPFKLIPSTRNEGWPAYSPDGKRIAFNSDRSGIQEIWVCNSDGSNAVQLTSIGAWGAYGPKWSPDGRSIAFVSTVGGNEDIYVVSANGGPHRRLTTGPSGGKWPCWSRDGQSIYFVSSGQVWKMRAAGGDAVQVTRNRGDVPQESRDGKFIYYLKGDPWPISCSVWRMPVGAGEETKVLDSVHCEGQWAVGRQGIYFFAKTDAARHSDLSVYEFATGKTRKILTIERPLTYWMAVSPDDRTILYTQLDEAGSDLMLVENFR